MLKLLMMICCTFSAMDNGEGNCGCCALAETELEGNPEQLDIDMIVKAVLDNCSDDETLHNGEMDVNPISNRATSSDDTDSKICKRNELLEREIERRIQRMDEKMEDKKREIQGEDHFNDELEPGIAYENGQALFSDEPNGFKSLMLHCSFHCALASLVFVVTIAITIVNLEFMKWGGSR